MGFFRKGVLGLLTTLLLVGLLGTALTTGLKLTVGSPTKMESLLKDSGFYKSFSDVVIEQAKSSSSSMGNDADFNSPLVQQAASQALSADFLEKQGNNFIDGNYNWLSGKTDKPEFKIDLGPARAAFAQNTGVAIANRLVTLPTCTNAQLADIKNSGQQIDPYTVPCLPFTVNPDEAGQELTKNLNSNSSFLNNAVLTPDSLNPSDKTVSQPYYQKLSNIPKFYQLLLKAPFILGALSLLLILGIVFLAQTRRKGLRKISIVLIVSGVILVLSKFLFDQVFKQLEKKLTTKSSDTAALQKSLLNLAHGLEKSLSSDYLYFGVGFLVIAIITLIIIRKGRNKTEDSATDHLLSKAPDNSLVPPTKNGITPRPKPAAPTATPKPETNFAKSAPNKKRPKRLIQ